MFDCVFWHLNNEKAEVNFLGLLSLLFVISIFNDELLSNVIIHLQKSHCLDVSPHKHVRLIHRHYALS